MTRMPRLVRLAGEFGGRFLLVMRNTDELSQLARSHGVVSLPTIKVYRHGKVVDTLRGAESEGVLRDFVRGQLADSTNSLLLNTLCSARNSANRRTGTDRRRQSR